MASGPASKHGNTMLLWFPASAFSSSLGSPFRTVSIYSPQHNSDLLGVEGVCFRLMLVGDWSRFSYTPPSPLLRDGQGICPPHLTVPNTQEWAGYILPQLWGLL